MGRPAHRVASVTSVRPARRSAPMARMRGGAAMILGLDRVLIWDRIKSARTVAAASASTAATG